MRPDPRPNYIAVDRRSAQRAIDYAPFRRQLRHSLRPASLIGPGLAIGLILFAGVVLYAVWSLAGPVTP